MFEHRGEEIQIDRLVAAWRKADQAALTRSDPAIAAPLAWLASHARFKLNDS